ncbi:MAG: aconitate hydratase [Candidatus Abyssobacteria bacterium SURF_17]|uniref:Aconitate hydratase n=1 Tax=Candidatus Abyssobacteria bacterium SURF_17 TaxID=2093361 RepID=A0A419F4A5_9BACT|nr:MAG: aconitate hydratase [Candidatus Abyssubacteria bacterium SURF_17]
MAQNLAEKLIESHLVEGKMAIGEEIGIRIDQTLTQDATGTMAFLEFESLGIPRVRTELSLSYIDHNIIQTDFKNADDHLFLETIAAKYGVYLSPPGNGVSHHVHRERFGVPGKTLLGSDSHTTTGGCLTMLAVGAGGLEVAMAMAGRPFYLMYPKTWGIRVKGKLAPWVSGKDLILELMRRFTCKAGVGKIMEFFGPGVKNLDMSARATIANMGVDIGATAAIFPSDQVTRKYLALNGREDAWAELSADKGADYDEVTELDLSAIEPLVACPHNPDNVKSAAELEGTEIAQVIVGSSTNGSYRDLMIAAKIVEGRRIHPYVSFEVNPGSRQTLENVERMGGVLAFIHAGARLHQSGCLGCIGMGQAPATNTKSLRTFPRNFKGRSGTKDDAVYLCSPEVAAASALAGCITDPRKLGEYPKVKYPKQFTFNPDWIIPPAKDPDTIEVIRGPNIAPFPHFEALPDTIEGEVLLKVNDNVSTDIIMPAGNRVLPLRSNIPAISKFVFDIIDENFHKKAVEKGGGIIVGGENYGQGSSREHAALAPRYLGIRAKLVKSFARIHKANLINFGIVPLEFAEASEYEKVNQGDKMLIANIREAIQKGHDIILVLVNGREIQARLTVSPRQREILLAGGLLNQARM